jgi:hypothetical protein
LSQLATEAQAVKEVEAQVAQVENLVNQVLKTKARALQGVATLKAQESVEEARSLARDQNIVVVLMLLKQLQVKLQITLQKIEKHVREQLLVIDQETKEAEDRLEDIQKLLQTAESLPQEVRDRAGDIAQKVQRIKSEKEEVLAEEAKAKQEAEEAVNQIEVLIKEVEKKAAEAKAEQEEREKKAAEEITKNFNSLVNVVKFNQSIQENKEKYNQVLCSLRNEVAKALVVKGLSKYEVNELVIELLPDLIDSKRNKLVMAGKIGAGVLGAGAIVTATVAGLHAFAVVEGLGAIATPILTTLGTIGLANPIAAIGVIAAVGLLLVVGALVMNSQELTVAGVTVKKADQLQQLFNGVANAITTTLKNPIETIANKENFQNMIKSNLEQQVKNITCHNNR